MEINYLRYSHGGYPMLVLMLQGRDNRELSNLVAPKFRADH